jgi:large repetitive protein
MRNILRSVTFLWLACVAMAAMGRTLPEYDAVARTKAVPNFEASLTQKTADYIRAGTRVQGDSRFGLPTFIWAGRNTASPSLRPGSLGGGRPEEAAARAHLGNYADVYNLNAEDVDNASVRFIHNIGKGPIIVKFVQKIGDVEVVLEEMNVIMNRKLELVAISGFISSQETPSAQPGANWNLDLRSGAAAAYNDLTSGQLNSTQLVPLGARNGYEYFSSISDIGLDIPIRMRKVLFHMPDGLVPAYHIEVATRNDNANGDLRTSGESDLDYYAYIISAHDGTLLLRHSLTQYLDEEALNRTRTRGKVQANLGPGGFTYRVWADAVTGIPLDGPQGNNFHPKLNATNDNAQPTLIPSNLVTLPNYPFSMNDPWLAPGATETVGNNVDAYVDLVNPNGYGVTGVPNSGISNDFRAQLTGVDTFGNNYDTNVRPNDATQRLAAIQQMFYNVNFLHDWFYDYGFDEVSLNAQVNNFGRGGLQNDVFLAEGQDMSNLDNANMNTPADGASPRMQMFIFQAAATAVVANPPGAAPSTNDGRFIQIQSPPSVATVVANGTVQFGQQPYDLTNDVVLANPPAACAALTNAAAINGKFVLVERQATGGPVCSLTDKIARAQNAGAVGFILINSQSTPTTTISFLGFITTGALGVPANGPVTMAIATMTWNQALPIKTELAVPNVVTLRIKRDVDRDGTIDTQVMMHEWGHYLQNRIIGNSLGLINQQGGGMGEGWGDFTALLFSVREDDILVPSNANWNGIYSMGSYVLTGGNTSQAAYFGIRRYPQTTDMTKNPLTLGRIVTGSGLPPGIPFVPKAADNAQVHNIGEVWSVALWECYASLLRDTLGATPRLTFAQARDRINTYYIAALKMTPPRPTLLSARDAMLAAAYATDAIDYQRFWTAYAKRGYGINAVAADPYSTNNVGTVESFVVGGELLFEGADLSTGASDCDADGILDSGDTVTLDITLRNTGNDAVSATTGTASSSDPNVTFPGGGGITFTSSDPYGTSTGSVAISYANAIAGIQTVPIQISYNDPSLGVPGPRIVNFDLRVNTNTILNNTATDTVESERLAWTPTVVTGTFPNFYTNTPWVREEVTATDHHWFGTDPDAMQDQALVSPLMTINGGGTLNIQWDHTWGFEFDGGGNYDGGVVEMSLNGGPWTDIGVGGVNSYNGTILNQGPTSNPLGGRPGFVANSPGSVHTTLTPAVAAGNTVQIRFRLGSDQIFGANGWSIDNIAFTGVIETPFDTVIADPGCIRATTTTLGAAPNPASFGSNVTLTATVTASSGTPTGNVTFFDGVTNLGTSPLVANQATLVVSTLSIGAHTLTAQYAGAPGFAASNSPGTPVTITKAASSLALVDSLDPSTLGSPVTFTATVSGTAGTPAGSVSFFDGASPLGTVALSGGIAALTTSSLTGGAHTINATYAGNATYLASSDSESHTVATGSTIAFNPTLYWKPEDGGTVTITVTRTGGNTSGSATVEYNTVNGTATGGVHYVSASSTVNFGPTETSKTFNITLNNNSDVSGKRIFTIVLSNPNAAVLGASVATVEIMDDDTVESDFSSPIDGKNDLVYRNEVTGDTRVYLMNGLAFSSQVDLLQNGGNWRLVGVADFNGDGNADLVYRNVVDFSMVIWSMNGTSLIGTGNVMAIPDANWKVAAVGDITGDGYPDIIWRHATLFNTAVWVMRENAVLSMYALPSIPDANWQIKGLGDFNNDTNLDIVWFHGPSYTTAAWQMTTNGTVVGSTAALTPTTGSPWQLAAIGDMNGDGDSDLMWQASSTRTVAIWVMNDNVRSSISVVAPTIADPNFSLVAPR